jgi:hypothetical protein
MYILKTVNTILRRTETGDILYIVDFLPEADPICVLPERTSFQLKLNWTADCCALHILSPATTD